MTGVSALQLAGFWVLFAALLCLGLAGGALFFVQGFASAKDKPSQSAVNLAVTLAIWAVTGSILGGLLVEVTR